MGLVAVVGRDLKCLAALCTRLPSLHHPWSFPMFRLARRRGCDYRPSYRGVGERPAANCRPGRASKRRGTLRYQGPALLVGLGGLRHIKEILKHFGQDKQSADARRPWRAASGEQRTGAPGGWHEASDCCSPEIEPKHASSVSPLIRSRGRRGWSSSQPCSTRLVMGNRRVEQLEADSSRWLKVLTRARGRRSMSRDLDNFASWDVDIAVAGVDQGKPC